MSSTQCLGTTKKGTRCLKRVANGQWCIYHENQNPGHGQKGTSVRNGGLTIASESNRTKPPPNVDPLNGYIYVYTLSAFLLKSGHGGWIQTRNLVNLNNHRNEWVDVDMKSLKILLVKVGMTTKTPEVRILQWEEKCNHKLACLYPTKHNHDKSSLLAAFKRLSIGAEQNFDSYDSLRKGFYVPEGVAIAERRIHVLLKQKYGRGEIHCTGCSEKPPPEPDTSKFWNVFRSKELKVAKYNIHNEWFPVPRKELDNVYRIIDQVCCSKQPHT